MKASWLNKYYRSDLATDLFMPLTGNGWGSGGRVGLRAQHNARRKYATDKKGRRAIGWLQFAFKVLSVALLVLFFLIIEPVFNSSLSPAAKGAIGGLMLAVWAVGICFALPVLFEYYAYSRGWLKRTIKKRGKR